MELFDKFGKFVMPSDAEIETLDAPTQEHFRAVQEASAKLETKVAGLRAAEQAVTDGIAERDNAETDLRVLRPKVDRVAEAKRWIESQRAL